MTGAKRNTFWARFGSGFFTLVLFGMIRGPAFAETYTVVLQNGLSGYQDTYDAFVDSSEPDLNIGIKDDMVVRYTPAGGLKQENAQYGLVKFTDFRLPVDARVICARLLLFSKQVMGSPTIAVHGLLKDFREGTKNFGSADDGGTTWNAAIHGQQTWGEAGAESVSDRFRFDQHADRHVLADDTVTVTKVAVWYGWDVSTSLAAQVAAGKLYGWLLRVTDTAEDELAVFVSRNAKASDAPVQIFPKLIIEYESKLAEKAPAPLLSAPKLILWGGHSANDPAQLLQDPESLEQFPFDGVAFPAGPAGLSIFSPKRVKAHGYEEYIKAARALLQPPSPLTTNFLKFSVYPGTLDPSADVGWESRGSLRPKIWFQDFDIVVHNMRVAARVARESGMVGLAFDWEPYGANPWKYELQVDIQEQGIGLKESQDQVRKLGKQFVRAINEEYPDMTLLIIPHAYAGTYGSRYQLIRPFLEGLFAAADSRMRIIDGNESAYYAQTADDFRRLYRLTYDAPLPTQELREKYLSHIGVGFGVWLERNGWGSQPELVNISSARWQVKLTEALAIADSLVWVFNGGSGQVIPNWFKAHPPNVPVVPEAYRRANQRARETARRARGECREAL